jgi:putative oxidoreductase
MEDKGTTVRNRALYDVIVACARVGVGVVFVAHGWQKLQAGITATGHTLHAMGMPISTPAAVYSTFAEILGGAALVLGLALPVAGILLFIDMAGALIFINGRHGIFLVANGHVHNGFELTLVLALASLLFAVGGGGRLSIDHLLFPQRRQRPRSPSSATATLTKPDVLVAGRDMSGPDLPDLPDLP